MHFAQLDTRRASATGWLQWEHIPCLSGFLASSAVRAGVIPLCAVHVQWWRRSAAVGTEAHSCLIADTYVSKHYVITFLGIPARVLNGNFRDHWVLG